MSEQKTETEMVSRESIRESFQKIVEANGYKKGTKIFKTAECSFLQGVMVADNRHAKHPYFAICIMSGRSILDE